jgi:pyrimidine operon attenuation protein/uracil phosphoribosyltransferase
MNKNKKILTSSDISRKIVRIGYEIVENYSDISRIVLLGIHNRGVPIAQRLKFL